MGLINVNLRTIQPATALTPVPDGWYKVRIAKSNIKTTAKGDGGYLELQHEVLEGQHQGRIVYWNLNLFNPSQQASEIAYKQLSAIGHCLGVFDLQDTNQPDMIVPQLHGQPYFIWVVIGQGNQGPINNVRGCKDINGNDPGKGAMGGPAAPMPMQQPGPQQWGPGGGQGPGPAFTTGGPGPASGGWAGAPPAGGPGGGSAPGGWSPPPAQNPAPMAAPQGPGGQPWQAGTNTQPQPTWQPNQPVQQQPQQTWQPPNQQQPPPQQQQPGWGGGQPTQPQQQQPPPNQAWQQGGPQENAPWRR